MSERKSSPSSADRGRKFTLQEDEKLAELVEVYGARKWNFLATMMPGRSGRQIRDRFQNYLNPKLENIPWTKEEDQLLYEKIFEVGPRYKALQVFFPNRSHNSITNRLKNSFFTKVINDLTNKSTAPSSPEDQDTNSQTFTQPLEQTKSKKVESVTPDITSIETNGFFEDPVSFWDYSYDSYMVGGDFNCFNFGE